MTDINEAAKVDLAELRKLAEAATPGPWRGDRYDGTVKYDLLGANDEPVISGDNGNSDHGPYGIRNESDEKFLMAANPAVVLALLDTIASQRQVIAGQDELATALEGALSVIQDYLEYEHNGDPWTEDARAMGEMDIDDYQRDGRLDAARATLAKAKAAAPVAPHQESQA